MENKEFNLRNYLYKNPLLEKEDTKKGNEEEQEHEEGAIKDDRDHIDALDADAEADEKKLKKLKKDKKEDVKEAALRKAIQNEIVSILREAEEVEDEENVDVEKETDVDVEDTEEVDVDVDKEVDIDDESAESEIEVDSELAGEDADTAAVLGLLTKAQEEAESLGDEKLMDQIGNTITYYTRAHVVKSGETRAELEEDREINEFLGFGSDIKKGGTLWVSGTEGNTRFRKIDKGVYKVEGTNQASFYVGEIWKPTQVKKLKVGMTIPLFGEILKLGDGKDNPKQIKI